MPLSPVQQLFIEKRRRLVRLWHGVGVFLLLLLMGLVAFLFWKSPYLVNPFAVISALEQETLEQPMLMVMVTLLPIMVHACLLLMIALIIFLYMALANERKHLRIIERLLAADENQRQRDT